MNIISESAHDIFCTEVKSMKKNNSQSSKRSQEFASETVIRQVKEQNRQAEMKKQQASGKFSNSSYNQSK